MNYVFHPAAEAEYLESIAFFESKRMRLGALFVEEFESLMQRVCVAPRRNAVESQPDVRRARMERFPFTVLYRETDGGFVEVLAVAHHRRRPQYWSGRR